MSNKSSDVFPYTCSVGFDGVVQSSVYGQLIADVIKFLLYQRHQIPMQYELLAESKSAATNGHVTQIGSEAATCSKQLKSINSMDDKKREKCISSLCELFNLIESIFSSCHTVRQILLMFGPTIMSPKESYLITLPEGVYDGQVMSLKQAKASFFKQVVVSECWSHLVEIKLTKLHMLVEASNKEDFSKFNLRPKQGLNINRGKDCRINIELKCRCALVSADLSQTDMTFDISGVEPLEMSALSIDDSNVTRQRHRSRSTKSLDDDHELIWYQVPITIEGFAFKH